MILDVSRFSILYITKCLTRLFYRFEQKWLSDISKSHWDKVTLIVFLNHTSLFEPLFLRLAPNHFLWSLSRKLIAPGADITLKRPLAGKVFKTLVPGVVPISRKRDDTWQQFLSIVNPDKITAILPEGRMKRRNGLDKHGNRMTVRGGVAEILQKLNTGNILFIYSGGLHHIQAPGDKWPRLFKRIKANMEMVDISKYKKKFSDKCPLVFKEQVVADMQNRLEDCTPK